MTKKQVTISSERGLYWEKIELGGLLGFLLNFKNFLICFAFRKGLSTVLWKHIM